MYSIILFIIAIHADGYEWKHGTGLGYGPYPCPSPYLCLCSYSYALGYSDFELCFGNYYASYIFELEK
jgi:hypothetical protein